MQGKNPILCTYAATYAVDVYSKGTLVDLVFDLATKAIGEDKSEEDLLAWIQEQAGPVLDLRKHKRVDLPARHRAYIQSMNRKTK
jgi:hypothetical protein